QIGIGTVQPVAGESSTGSSSSRRRRPSSAVGPGAVRVDVPQFRRDGRRRLDDERHASANQRSVHSVERDADAARGNHRTMEITNRRADAAGILVAMSARDRAAAPGHLRSEEHTSELQSRENLVCRLLLEKKKTEQVMETNREETVFIQYNW